MKKTMTKKIAAWALMAAFIPANTLLAAGITGTGNIGVYRDGKVVQQLAGDSQINANDMLVCSGQCSLRSSGITLTANDQSRLAVRDSETNFDLFLAQGRVDFAITSAARTISFHTPEGTYSSAAVVFNAATEPVVRGWAQISPDGSTEIGVTEGKMVFTTADGEKIVDANHKIQLAASELPAEDEDDDRAAAMLFGGSGKKGITASGAPPWLGGAVLIGGGLAILTTAIVSSSDSGDTAYNVAAPSPATPDAPTAPVAPPSAGGKGKPSKPSTPASPYK